MASLESLQDGVSNFEICTAQDPRTWPMDGQVARTPLSEFLVVSEGTQYTDETRFTEYVDEDGGM